MQPTEGRNTILSCKKYAASNINPNNRNSTNLPTADTRNLPTI